MSRTDFERQLDLILEEGAIGCSLADVRSASSQVVGITFDDGMLSDYTIAFPALRARGMTATFFVVSGLVGSPGRASWAHLREMAQAGMSIQSHTHRHPFLSELTEDELRVELEESKAIIDEAIGQSTEMLALPGGDPPRRTLSRLIYDAGYRVVANSRWGVNRRSAADGPQTVRRCTIAGAHDDREFRRILRGDRALALRRQARETVLGFTRRLVGPSRYAEWRRAALRQVIE